MQLSLDKGSLIIIRCIFIPNFYFFTFDITIAALRGTDFGKFYINEFNKITNGIIALFTLVKWPLLDI